MDDVRAVLDAVGSERAALLGVSEGGPMCALFAATYPERRWRSSCTEATRAGSARPNPGASPRRTWPPSSGRSRKTGADRWAAPRAPSAVGDERFMRLWASYLVQSASPQAALSPVRMNAEIDVRPILPAIRVPALIFQRTGDRVVRTEEAPLPGRADPRSGTGAPCGRRPPAVGRRSGRRPRRDRRASDGHPERPQLDRVLATVLFTDIVDSTKKAAELGDAPWKGLLHAHDERVRTDSPGSVVSR